MKRFILSSLLCLFVVTAIAGDALALGRRGRLLRRPRGGCTSGQCHRCSR